MLDQSYALAVLGSGSPRAAATVADQPDENVVVIGLTRTVTASGRRFDVRAVHVWRHREGKPRGLDVCLETSAAVRWDGLLYALMSVFAARDERLADGRRALERGRWQRAKAFFESALEKEESPEALEGLGAAAWWLDDAVTVFEARERAYRLYRERGDAAGAARVAAALAENALEYRGEPGVASGWFQRAHRLLEGLGPVPERGIVAAHEGRVALLLDNDVARARQLAAETVEAGRRHGLLDLEMLGLALEGLVLVSEGELAEGMRRLDEATVAATAGEMSEPAAIAFTCCYQIYACERARDYDRARQWCERVKDFCARLGIPFMMGICRSHYAMVLVFRGAWEEAEREIVAAERQLAVSRPGFAGEAGLRLGELRLRQGRLDEAEALFARAELHPAAQLGLATLAFERGDPRWAADRAELVLRQVPAAARTERAVALELLVQARSSLGEVEAAGEALTALRSIADAMGTPLMRASLSFAQGAVATAAGDHDSARRCYEDAVALFDGSGLPYETAVARHALARALAATGRQAQAVRQAREALEAQDRLGALHAAGATRSSLAAIERGELDPRHEPGAADLTARQLEILRLVAHGLSNHEIAERLVLSEHTVHRHVANILARLRVSSRAAAVTRAARLKLL